MNDKYKAISKSLRSISIDAIEKAKSGHPGLPMGCADIISVLFSKHINLNPHIPNWINRDRFVLSAGHGSMLLYSILHLSGFDISLDDIKKFRVIESKTPGHPEFAHTPGVESTTGPLGAGISNGIGMAIAQEHLASKFNTRDNKILDNYTYILAGDGCLMEGISYEAASLAGHLGLSKIILLYDSNNITIEGPINLSTSEDTLLRFRSMGWHTLEGDGHNYNEIDELIELAKLEISRPTIIKFNTIIGYGSPNRQGTSGIHGAPLGEDEIKLTRQKLEIPANSEFYIDHVAKDFFKEKQKFWLKKYNSWNINFDNWSRTNKDLRKVWDEIFSLSYDFNSIEFEELPASIATRKSSGIILNNICDSIHSIIGGSADLSPSTNTYLNNHGDFNKMNRSGRNIHFGIREHAMAGICNGIALYGGLRPYNSTFLVFSDYMRPAIRLSALMALPVIYVFTHDSVFLGKDGPTHQPVEQLESLRNIPGLTVIRPCDHQETKVAWEMALKNIDGPTAIILSRQNLTLVSKPSNWIDEYKNGGYIVYEEDNANVNILATGSEVNMALEILGKTKNKLRIISISSRKLFDKNQKFTDIINNNKTITLEAGVTSGWEKYTRNNGYSLGIDRFGHSGSSGEVADILDFTTKVLIRLIDE